MNSFKIVLKILNLSIIYFQNNLQQYDKIRVILGNETCDLDSAVCALVHGLFHSTMLEKAGTKNVGVIALLNVPKREFKIKTEVVFYLQHHGIQLEHLTFRSVIVKT